MQQRVGELTEIMLKRVYEPATADDGRRILVDRLWPRGLSREAAAIAAWARDAAPSDELRKWYRHDPARWEEFLARYRAELEAKPEAVDALVDEIRRAPRITFLFASRELALNNAAALRAIVGRWPTAAHP